MGFHKTKAPTEKEINQFLNDESPLTKKESEAIKLIPSDFSKKIINKYYKGVDNADR